MLSWLGDFNIDLLGVNNSGVPGEFLDIIYSSFFNPLIGKPTRITINTATLIDNIFTNVFDDKTACINGLLCADISDHIPIFHIHKLSNENFKDNKKVKHIRKYDEYSMESFISNLDCTDWRKCKNNEDPNIYYNNFIKKFTDILTTVSHLKRLSLNIKALSPGLLKAYF